MAPDFSLKLLSGQSLIMVEAPGYDSEIFTPQIISGRISLTNVVLKRRCCFVSRNNSTIYERKPSLSAAPMANSTPNASNNKWTQPRPQPPTPEPARRALVQMPTPNLGPGVKIVRLYRKPSAGTPQNAAKVLSPSPCQRQRSLNRPNLILSDVQIHPPSFSTTMSPRRSLVSRTVSQPSPARPLMWGKCITPKRTYSRRPVSAKKSSGKKMFMRTPRCKNGKRQPDFMRNPTEGVKPAAPIDVERRRILVDSKVLISPKTFRLQIRTAEDLKRNRDDYLPRTKLDLQRKRHTAFDLITQPHRSHCYAHCLKRQFRNGCVRKTAPNDQRCRALVENIPPLEADDDDRFCNRKRLEFGDCASAQFK